MPEASTTAQRLENLEIKASTMDDVLDALNLTIYRQQEQMDRLAREVLRLREQGPHAGGTGEFPGAADERPPHY